MKHYRAKTTRNLRLVFLVVIFAFPLDAVYAQGELLSKGKSGLGFSCGLAASKLSTSFGLSSGYSISGQLDVNVSLGRVSVIRTTDGYTIPTTRGMYVSPAITYYLVRQEEGVDDVSIGMTAAYEHISYSPEYVLGQHADVFLGGVSFFQELLRSPDFKLQPVVNIVLSRGEKTDVLALGGLFFGLKDTIGQIVGLTLSVAYQSSFIITGIDLSVVI